MTRSVRVACASSLSLLAACTLAHDYPIVELCRNGIDDDGDALVDCADPACVDQPGCLEGDEASCADSVDNDDDGTTDCEDPSCDGYCAEKGVQRCQDGRDNDGDGAVDADDIDCFLLSRPLVTTCVAAEPQLERDFSVPCSGEPPDDLHGVCLSDWSPWGAPAPTVVEGALDPDGVGDNWCHSGVTSVSELSFETPGLELRARVRFDFDRGPTGSVNVDMGRSPVFGEDVCPRLGSVIGLGMRTDPDDGCDGVLVATRGPAVPSTCLPPPEGGAYELALVFDQQAMAQLVVDGDVAATADRPFDLAFEAARLVLWAANSRGVGIEDVSVGSASQPPCEPESPVFRRQPPFGSTGPDRPRIVHTSGGYSLYFYAPGGGCGRAVSSDGTSWSEPEEAYFERAESGGTFSPLGFAPRWDGEVDGFVGFVMEDEPYPDEDRGRPIYRAQLLPRPVDDGIAIPLDDGHRGVTERRSFR